MARFRIEAAKADLERIARFTEKHWGREQRDRYLSEIDRVFHRLSENPQFGKGYEDVGEGYRTFPVGSHVRQ